MYTWPLASLAYWQVAPEADGSFWLWLALGISVLTLLSAVGLWRTWPLLAVPARAALLVPPRDVDEEPGDYQSVAPPGKPPRDAAADGWGRS